MDGVRPDCQTAQGCIIPALHPLAARAMEIHRRLLRTQRLKISGDIMRIMNATEFDIELLAIAEDELNRREDSEDGNGHEMAVDC